MVGRDVLLRVEKSPSQPGRPDPRGRGPARARRPRPREGARRLLRGARRARSSAIAGVDGNGQTELIDAITGLRHPESGPVLVEGREVTNASARQHFDVGVGHIPEDRQRRGLVLDFSLAENIGLHDYRKPPYSRFGWLYPKRLVERASRLIRRVRRPRRRAADAGRRALRRQPAEGHPRPGDRPRSARPRRGAADAWPRRRRDRVRAPAARRGARRRARRPARLARARGGPVARGPHPRHLRGRDRRRVPARRRPRRSSGSR